MHDISKTELIKLLLCPLRDVMLLTFINHQQSNWRINSIIFIFECGCCNKHEIKFFKHSTIAWNIKDNN